MDEIKTLVPPFRRQLWCSVSTKIRRATEHDPVALALYNIFPNL